MTDFERSLAKRLFKAVVCSIVGATVIALLVYNRDADVIERNQYVFFLLIFLFAIIALAGPAIAVMAFPDVIKWIGVKVGYKAMLTTMALSTVVMLLLCAVTLWHTFTSDVIHIHAVIMVFAVTGVLMTSLIAAIKNRPLKDSA